MNYYPFHIGDYIAATAHLEPMEDLAYRRMIDVYYTREVEFPADPAEVAKLVRLRGEVDAVTAVLKEFFDRTETGWSNRRCDYEISEAQSKRSKAQQSAAQRWDSERKANAMRTHTEGNAPNPNPNPNPKGEPNPISGYPPEFESAWEVYPRRPGASKRDAFKAWSARIKNGVAAEEMHAGVKRYAFYCLACGTEPQYVKQPTTFFGPSEHYLSDWAVPPARGSPSVQIGSRAAASMSLTGRGNQNGNQPGGNSERDITSEAVRVA